MIDLTDLTLLEYESYMAALAHNVLKMVRRLRRGVGATPFGSARRRHCREGRAGRGRCGR